mmetsp:Transcript_20576/g.44799  ORF Transcript_20576/g.44799 Transcript_20576/m.44799 type:complete len:83 (+) Transcript_20576:331-579(+)
MGCGASKNGLEQVDDSVHVMFKHDKKVQQKKGEPEHRYKERAIHPLLRPKEAENPAPLTANGGASNTGEDAHNGIGLTAMED